MEEEGDSLKDKTEHTKRAFLESEIELQKTNRKCSLAFVLAFEIRTKVGMRASEGACEEGAPAGTQSHDAFETNKQWDVVAIALNVCHSLTEFLQ